MTDHFDNLWNAAVEMSAKIADDHGATDAAAEIRSFRSTGNTKPPPDAKACKHCVDGKTQVGSGHASADGGEEWEIVDCHDCGGTG